MEVVAKVPNPDLENMMQIALASLEAGEALPDIAESRGMEAVAYKYGMHLPNWFNGFSEGLKREVEATLPVSLTFLDNCKGEGLIQVVTPLQDRGVKPYLVYRPYFDPPEDGPVTGAMVEDYASGAVIRMRDDYFRFPLIKQAYDEGRFIVKLFNETNIGGEGFARGRAGFAEAQRYWKQARAIVKAAYPNAKILSLCNTPGNDDVWFTSDTQNAPYWYHGAEAAKPNPTQADIQRAIASCPFREMFELCDIIGIHVYANIRSTVDGNLATWYSRRHEQALKFLTPYTNAGKKLIINEWDLGYDEGQEYRAEAVVYGLRQIVGPNDAILFVNHWWNADKNEGSGAWDKHRTREDGVFRQVVNAIKAFRDGALPPVEPPPTNPIPVPPPTGGEINLPAWCSVIRATVPAGQQYWKLIKAWWQDDTQSAGTHHIYAVNPHDASVEMWVKWGTTTDKVKLEKGPNEPAGNYAMFGAVYSAQLVGRGTELSDKVSGMKLPSNHHVSYFLEWELVTQPIGGFMIDRRYMGRAGMGENYGARPAGVGADGFVLHHTGGSFASSLDWLTNATSGVGTHYLINTDGAIYQLVEDIHAAWHAGYSILNGREDCNRFTLGVELVNAGDGQQPYPQVQQDALVWLLKEKVREHEITRMWVETHQKVRADFKARYPTATNPDGSPIGYKTDPRGLDVPAILNRVYPPVVPPLPPVPQWTQEDAAKAAYFMEEMARAMRGDTDARTRLIGALVNEPPRVGAHNVIVAVGLPPVYEERD